MKYFAIIDGRQVGPIEESQLLSYRVTRETLVWREGMAQWMPISSLPELNYLFTGGTPPNPATGQGYGPGQGGYGGYAGQQQWGGSGFKPAKPETYLVFAILVTLFCCLPFGIVGIINAAAVDSAYNAGQYEEAQQKSQSAKKWSMWGLIVGAVGSILYGLFIIIAAMSEYNFGL